ncbi:response regulator receiver domain protein [Bacteriovorax sp. DB6_IX]|nr:response regulator receiver domain protein [Bacteriovorax sp. DB6_IX]
MEGEKMPERYKFLLVDDEPDIKEIYEIFLSNLLGKDFQFQFFLNGEECMNYMNNNCTPDDKVFVITDINMPIMDGFTLLKNLKESFRGVEVAICSAYDTNDYKTRGKDLGAIEFLPKPVDFERVASMIEERITA